VIKRFASEAGASVEEIDFQPVKTNNKIKPVVLDTKFNGQMKDPWGNTRAGFKATTSLNRKDFGFVWNKTLEAGGLLVGESVDVIINKVGFFY